MIRRENYSTTLTHWLDMQSQQELSSHLTPWTDSQEDSKYGWHAKNKLPLIHTLHHPFDTSSSKHQHGHYTLLTIDPWRGSRARVRCPSQVVCSWCPATLHLLEQGQDDELWNHPQLPKPTQKLSAMARLLLLTTTECLFS